MQCPTCNQPIAKTSIVVCDKCGDTRCSSKVAKKGCASLGKGGYHSHTCGSCKKGKYKRI